MSPWEVLSLPLPLDHTIPFVAAIFRLISGEDALDDAIAIFEAAEEKHGVRCLYTPNSFLGGSYMPRTPDAARLSHLYPLLEDYKAFQTAYVQVDDPTLVPFFDRDIFCAPKPGFYR